MVLEGRAGADILNGGSGVDTADYGDKSTSVVVRLNAATNVTVKVGGVNEDTIRNIEDVTGGTAADRLTGDGPSNTLRSGLGADILNGGVGRDTFQAARVWTPPTTAAEAPPWPSRSTAPPTPPR